MEETKELQNKAQACLKLNFPKGDKRRGDALAVAAMFQMLGRKEMEYIINNSKTTGDKK